MFGDKMIADIFAQGVGPTLMVLAGVIAVDTIFGIALAIKNKQFDVFRLPEYLGTNILPVLGGVGVLALMAEYVNLEFFGIIFFGSAALALPKYGVELWEKTRGLLGINITHSDGIGDGDQEIIDPNAGL